MFIAFDVLEVAEVDVRSRPLRERRRVLREHRQVRGVQLIEHVETRGEALFRAAADDYEGSWQSAPMRRIKRAGKVHGSR